MTKSPLIALMLTLAALLGACASDGAVGPNAIAGKTPDAYIEMQKIQAAYIGNGSAGTGNLIYNGQVIPFNVTGLGVGGIGVSELEAEGEVYNMPDLAMFPGTYAQARFGFVVGTISRGQLWMQNNAGVILHLQARRRGLMLSTGADAVVIQMQR